MNEPLINTVALSKVFSTDSIETKALDGISLSIGTGEFIALMGPSGCGKSTLLNILGMLDSPTGGEYYFMGQEVSGLSEKGRSQARKGNIGFVFQSFNLIDEMTVFENIELPLLYLKRNVADRRKKVKEILEYMQIPELKSRFPYQLSGGQQQRVALARAVVFEPKLILADEPTGNLDLENSRNIMNLLSQLNQEGITILLVTHEKDFADYSHRIVNILDGKINKTV